MGGPVYARNLFNVSSKEEYLAYSRRSPREVDGERADQSCRRHKRRRVGSGVAQGARVRRREIRDCAVHGQLLWRSDGQYARLGA